MIAFSLYLLSETHFRIFFKKPLLKEAATIQIFAMYSKSDSQLVKEKTVIRDVLLYDIIVSNNSLPNIYDAMLKLVVLDEDKNIIDESRLVAVSVKENSINRGIIKVVRNDFRVASLLNGGVAYFIKMKKSGTKCDVCWDEDLNSPSNSNCKTCGGTGYVKSYFIPYKTTIGPAMNLTGEGKATDEVGKINNNIPISFTSYADYPLSADDIVFSVRHGAVLRVTETTISETQGIPVLQGCVSQELPTQNQDTEAVHKILVENFGELYAR